MPKNRSDGSQHNDSEDGELNHSHWPTIEKVAY